MNFEDWEPIYRLILSDFGFSRKDDELAAELLSEMLEMKSRKKRPEVMEINELRKIISGRDVLVCGKALGLQDDIKKVDIKKYLIIAADGATSILLDNGIIPNIIVTDLDGNMDDEARANARGAIVAVHAHGDNMDALRREVPGLKKVIGTAQSKPMQNVYNFGGFSDGDRCVFLAREMGAGTITLAGFDFNDPNVTPVKKKKLMWAEKLINCGTK
jgi:uncharacterized Rossmann fold enzyme